MKKINKRKYRFPKQEPKKDWNEIVLYLILLIAIVFYVIVANSIKIQEQELKITQLRNYQFSYHEGYSICECSENVSYEIGNYIVQSNHGEKYCLITSPSGLKSKCKRIWIENEYNSPHYLSGIGED